MSDMPTSDGKPLGPQKRFKWLTGWSKLFLEMLAITFGVLLAFGLNAWWEGRSQAAFDRSSLSQVYSEIDRNYDALKASYEYRTKLYPQLLQIENGTLSITEIEFQGTRPPRIETAAYDLSLMSGVFARLEPDEAQTIVRTYLGLAEIKQVHSLYSGGLLNLIAQVESEEDPRIISFMRAAFNDMIYAEGGTLNQISDFSEKPTVIEPWDFMSEVSKASEAQRAGSE